MHTTSPTHTIRRSVAGSLAAAAGALLLLGLTACTPSADTGTELKTDNTEISMVDWRQKMDDCMKEAGFDLASGSGEGGMSATIDTSTFDMEAFDTATTACTAKIGEAPVDENLPTDEEIFESGLIFAKCMRDAGYDYPDPVKGSNMMSAFSTDVDTKVVDDCSTKAYATDGSE